MWRAVLCLATLVACRPDDAAAPPLVSGAPTDIEIGWWPHPDPLIEGGEVILGLGGRISVLEAPAGAVVELYRSEVGQGRGPCTFPRGICAGILEPELVATGEADTEGRVQFTLTDDPYDGPAPIAWQALVYDPDGLPVAAFTEALARHVGVHPGDGRVTFAEITGAAGLDPIFTSGNSHTGGVAFVDLNGDHWPDLYVANGAGLNNYLYLNNGDGTFSNGSLLAPKPDTGLESAGVKVADIDNDGDHDILVPVDYPAPMISFVEQVYEGGPNLLFLNNGDGTYTESAEAAGVVDPRGWRTSSASFADYDLDGCIDTYLTNWAMAHLPAGDNADRLLKGNCDGTFTDVTAATGVDGKGRDGLIGFWWDADFDRYPELYVGINSDIDDPPDFQPDDLYYKNDGGTFSDWTDHTPGVGQDAWAAMGIDVGDIDADGDWDLYITDVWELEPLPKGNVLYKGEPDGTLSTNACQESGICFGYNSWPTNFADFDNDGWVDLWVGSSWPTTPDLLYLNRGDGSGRFDLYRQDGWAYHTARGGAVADYDGDGDVDIFLWDENADSSLWRNEGEPEGHWVQLKLFGRTSNASAIGAVARLSTDDGPPQMRRVSGGDSAHSQRSMILHFGVADAERADLEITWPSGTVTDLPDVPVDRVLFVDEDDGLIAHRITVDVATWDAATGELLVEARSNFGGRPSLAVDGIGPLVYDARTVTYSAVFPLPSAPASIRVISGYGGEVELPVQVVGL